MKEIYHQLIGKNNKKGQLVVITSKPIKFTAIDGIRGVYEEGVKGAFKELVKKYKIKDFADAYDLPIHTVKKLRRSLGVTKAKKTSDKKNSVEFIKLD